MQTDRIRGGESGDESKMPDEINSPGILFWRRPTLARPIAVLPSGLQRFTAVFGMGMGGATALLSPEVRAGLALNRTRGFVASQQRKPTQTSGDRRPPYNFSPRSATAATTFSKEHDFQSAIANRKSAILVIL